MEIQAAFELEKTHAAKWIDLLKPDDEVRSKRRMLTAVAIQVFQSFSGSTVIAYYATPIFQVIYFCPANAPLAFG
jgi:Sugar (and other) transporter